MAEQNYKLNGAYPRNAAFITNNKKPNYWSEATDNNSYI